MPPTSEPGSRQPCCHHSTNTVAGVTSTANRSTENQALSTQSMLIVKLWPTVTRVQVWMKRMLATPGKPLTRSLRLNTEKLVKKIFSQKSTHDGKFLDTLFQTVFSHRQLGSNRPSLDGRLHGSKRGFLLAESLQN